ncbi:MAG: flagellar basal body P-ring formation protein FlgA [Rhizobiales bacterium]|nr:flagellar basal body P-ring formation protein FlgA [Hyphomicrobiales bacterium]
MRQFIASLAFAALLGLAPSAWAADEQPAAEAAAPVLRSQALIAGEIVRIGDLVENAGAAAGTPIFRAPELGQTGSVATPRIIDALRPHGLARVDTRGLREVQVTRQTHEIGLKELEPLLISALGTHYRLGQPADLLVALDRDAQPMLIDPAGPEPRVLRAYYDRYNGRFDVTFELPGRHRTRYLGTITETAEAVVVARTIGRGETIRAGDVMVQRLPKANVVADTVATLGNAVGLAARRALRSGQALTASDLMQPELVVKNEAVTIVYEVPGMLLSVRGKAIDSGAEGDTVAVLNAQTKRTLQGVVSGPGRVTIPGPYVATASTPAPTSVAAAAPADVTGAVAARAQANRTE